MLMQGLSSYISTSLNINNQQIDGHYHAFDAIYFTDSLKDREHKKAVCFADLILDKMDQYKDDKLMKRYEQYIDKYYNRDHDILLATGLTAKQAIDIYEKWPKKIKGFGEFKLYKVYDETEVNMDKLTEIRNICSYIYKNKLFNMPVYIHYELVDDKHIHRLESLLADFPRVNIVLCHCGMLSDGDNDDIYETAVRLMQTYKNLWCDLTYSAAKYFNEYPMKVFNLPSDRIFSGTDINPTSINSGSKVDVFKYSLSDTNIKHLFNIL